MSGIELSIPMADRLRAKDDAQGIQVDVRRHRHHPGERHVLDGVYLVFNAIGLLTTQDQQVAVFANAAASLEPGGYFLIEVGVPDLRLGRLPPGEDARVFAHAPGYVAY